MNNKLKLIAFFNSYVEGISGGDIRFIEIVKRMTNFNKIIVTPSLGKKFCEKNKLKANYIITTKETKVRIVPVIYVFRIIKALITRIKINASDLLFSSSDFLPDVLPAFLLKKKNPKARWIASIYHLIPPPSKRPGSYNVFNIISYIEQKLSLAMISRWADFVQTETSILKSMLCLRYHISPDKIIVVSGGLNPESIDKIGWEKGKIYDACFLARLHPSKGVFDLIKAWKYVCSHKEDAKLAIAGSGPIKIIDSIKNKIKEFNLKDNVILLGFLSDKEKYKLLKASKVFVLPSYEEGIPVSFYEAMYCGLPVITYYLPTYEEIKSYIVSVPLGDVKKLAEEIIGLLGDESLARKLGEKGREFAKEHTWDKVAECIISQLEKLG
jgi:glycosyltransferase involved in cell wall biosynthesis